eukprot:TRINITY_DN2550_c0_g1_i5.p1 TRINITY_DN2550_c0_g1~~TRINITY_DN2550_c0_g1_i5.p1  ORF type:complete len:298 (+),score=47.19 TRINITY_DN2550_c0_g1_i5:81-974(+)
MQGEGSVELVDRSTLTPRRVETNTTTTATTRPVRFLSEIRTLSSKFASLTFGSFTTNSASLPLSSTAMSSSPSNASSSRPSSPRAHDASMAHALSESIDSSHSRIGSTDSFASCVLIALRKRYNWPFFRKLVLMNIVTVLVVFYISALPLTTSDKEFQEGNNFEAVPWFLGVEFVCAFFLFLGVCLICYQIMATSRKILFGSVMFLTLSLVMVAVYLLVWFFRKDFSFYGLEMIAIVGSVCIVVVALSLRKRCRGELSLNHDDESFLSFRYDLEARFKEKYKNREILPWNQRIYVVV